MTDQTPIKPLYPGALQKPEDFLCRLPIKLAPKTFRKMLREAGLGYQHRRQLVITEEHFQQFLETLKVPCPSSSRKSARSGTSTVRSTATEFERVRERIAESTRRQREKSFSET